MKSDYRYIFDPSSKKFTCPECGQRRFVRFIDSLTGEYIEEQFGRCDREDNCGYFLNPYKNVKYKNKQRILRKATSAKSKRPVTYIPQEVLSNTLIDYEHNDFIQNLLTNIPYPLSKEDIETIIAQYYIGTISLGKGTRVGSTKGYATTFPFIDKNGNVRAIQAKQFDQSNHSVGTNFVHKIIEKQYTYMRKQPPEWIRKYNENELKVSCLFGAHLLRKYPRNPIVLVEAPKTAIYGTLYFGFPDDETKLLWLAVYNKSSLNLEKCRDLEGRRIFLFPDLSKEGKTFEEWSNKGIQIEQQLKDTKITVSDLLEKYATTEERIKGFDVADFLIKQDWRQFRGGQG